MAVMILSSSRGGSTIFTEVLRRHPGLRHLPGEINPLLRLAGLWRPGCDVLTAEQAEGPKAEHLQQLLRSQAGGYGPVSPKVLAGDVEERLRWQWPSLSIPAEAIQKAVEKSWDFQEDLEAFTASVLSELQPRWPLHPGLYDLPQSEPPPLPDPKIVEEPPFILFAPWQRREQGPLLIKTPSNAYRLPFFERFFGSEPMRCLHLVRNPAASINGLMDGWLFPGFHSHYLPGLRIRDYAVPGSDTWWKFDLPPDWQSFLEEERSLVEVCAYQWRSAQQAILHWKRLRPEGWLTVRFEDFLRDPEGTMERVCTWLEVPLAPELLEALKRGFAPRMATARPRQRRWFDRHRELEPVLPALQELAEELGYRDREEWL